MVADPLTAEQRILRARLAAYALHAHRDRHELTAPARTARWQRYLDEVDPDGQLSDEERQRRATLARRRDMVRLAYQSSRARQARRTGTGA